MKKYLKIGVPLVLILGILYIVRIFFPYIILVDIEPMKSEYNYGDTLVFKVRELNPYPFPYNETYNSTCTTLDIYGDRRSSSSNESCGDAFTDVWIMPFWFRSYTVEKTLVPYNQEYDNYYGGNILFVGPGQNRLSIGNRIIPINISSSQDIDAIASDCSIYTNFNIKKGCIRANPKSQEDCKIAFDEDWGTYGLEACIEKISNNKQK